jgi:CBS-domain-containing membrane protein
MCEQISEFDRMSFEASVASAEARRYEEHAKRLDEILDVTRKELERVSHEHMITVTSRRWRLLDRPARIIAAVRGWRKR